MCDPVSIAIAGLALSAATTYASYAAAEDNADKQQEALDKAENLNQMDLARQRDQQAQAGAQQMNEAGRQAAKDGALFDAISGEFGGGVSVDRAGAGQGIQNSEKLATINQNVKAGMSENGFASMASVQQTNSRLAAIQRPSAIGSSLQLGASGLNIYSNYRKQTAEIEAQKQAMAQAKAGG